MPYEPKGALGGDRAPRTTVSVRLRDDDLELLDALAEAGYGGATDVRNPLGRSAGRGAALRQALRDAAAASKISTRPKVMPGQQKLRRNRRLTEGEKLAREAAVLDALHSIGGAGTAAEIATAMGVKPNYLYRTLNHLADAVEKVDGRYCLRSPSD